MALAFGLEFDPEDMGAPRFARLTQQVRRSPSAPPWARPASFARDWFASSTRETPTRRTVAVSPETIRCENEAIADAFDRIADLVGVTEAERAVLPGVARDPSRLVMALETLGAALDLCGDPAATLDWLRSEIQQAPFNGQAPLTLIAGGRLGAEIVLIHLRGRLRKTMLS